MYLVWPCHGTLPDVFDSAFFKSMRIPHICLFLTYNTVYRSLGDVVAHSAGVISDPEFTEFELDPATDKFLVVATDGLWEFVDNQETVDMVEAEKGPIDAVDTLVQEASQRWMHEEQVIDDTTIIVANLFNYKSS